MEANEPGKSAHRLLPAREEPESMTEAEAAEWYDTHDTSQLATEPVVDPEHAPVATLQTISVRVSSREAEELGQRAKRLGIDCTSYIHVLINRHLLDEAPLQ